MKKFTMKNKILILLSFVFIFISSFAISTFAYHVDSNGNLVSDNLINYQDINSNRFTDLGNNSFRLNWGGAVTTITLPYTDFNENTQYSMTITKVSGANYWAYQFFWNYNDNTSERFTNNQGVVNGTYSYTSALNKTLSSITIVLNYEADFSDMMLNVGEPKSFEPYGSIYFKERIVSSLGLLNYTNIKYGYFEHANSYQYNTIYRSAFIYNGNYGHLYDTLDLFDWNDFELDSNNFIYNKIYSKYGSFYNTEWNAYSFITNYGSYSDNDNIPFTMNYEFIAPISFTDVAFSFNAFELVYFYDSNGFLLKTITPNDNELLSLTDVSKIVCYNHINDIIGDSNYIITDLYAGSYDIGYSNGYNNALSYANPIIDEYKQAIDTYKDTIHILSERISSLENSNRNYTNLIWTIGATPWESFKHIWNVEFGGINIANIITGLVTALLVIYLIKKIWK